MSAKEMFEKLGYAVVYTNDNGDIEYKKQFEYVKVTIYFVNKEKVIEMSSDAEITYTIEFDELQAINKQVEELGWK